MNSIQGKRYGAEGPLDPQWRSLEELTREAAAWLHRQTGDGAADEHQVAARHLARMATLREAAGAFRQYVVNHGAGEDGAWAELVGGLGMAWLADDAAWIVDRHGADLGLDDAALAPMLNADARRIRRTMLAEVNVRALGRLLLDGGPENNRPIPTESGSDGEARELRAATRRFAQDVVAPEAESIHREDRLIPEHLITRMAKLGYFGMSVPEEYGGVGMSNLMMILATEELSAASLPAAGSLITRPEILCKALLKGGTEEQKRAWLPPIARGDLMVAVSVTEPNIGSDVARITCRADALPDGSGYSINGAKAWCTFAGRADILALLARTNPDPAVGHKGLSLFIVEKDRFTGRDFTMVQRNGGRITGKADATMGYRGMHSFTLQFEDYVVPGENLVGGESGLNRGFYLQMGGFAAGRLQTGGRAVGLAQACLEAAVRYAHERPQFGRPIAQFQNTQYEIGLMAIQLEAARQLTYAAARAMDRGADNAALLAAMAKLFASRAAVDISQRAQLLHGGWGYAEEYAISRYVADALVLPIFEGVEPILEMKVIARGLMNPKSS